ncbi:unnamed protein product [Fusarium venenatum]|uniref:F-box domain-containing protein n=1 Tax=Fusarium venenatum TaxID=56646 RepID=A0A2L2SWQ3_9HYPO|nr:uncharacterized protein FVRRES_06650 [Fusarium venenatum]CEI62214.1 unnamed protein product [Fusarium venenatum]
MTHNIHVPLEITLQILEADIPPGRPNRILDVSEPSMQQLLTWTKHCIYFDSASRLRRFLQCLGAEEDGASPSTLPKTMRLCDVSAVYLGLGMEEIQTVETNATIRDLLITLGGSVRRLIVDLPYRRIAQEHTIDPHIDTLFSRGLRALTNLEELTTLGGLPSLEFWRDGYDIGQTWPKLRRVAGFKMNLAEEALWSNVARDRTIEHLVITMPYVLRRNRWNIKRAIGGKEWNNEQGGDSTNARPLKVVIAQHEYTAPMLDTQDENLYDPEGFIDLSRFEIPVIAKRVDWLCKDWLVRSAKDDTLWG